MTEQKLAEITDFSSLSPSEQDLYDESLKKFRDTIAVLRHAQRQGLAEGRAEGRAAMIETARKLKQRGMDNQTIADVTNIPEDEIASL